MPASNHVEKKTLVVVLVINAGMFVVEIITGLISESTALIADSLDMLADASVYGLGLYAVGRSLAHKTRAAMTSGVLQILLGGLVLADILRRLLVGSEPLSIFMIGIGLLALTANITCLVLIAKYRRGEIHMRATWIFSRNDVIANLGIILGGILVAVLGSPLPDLIIGGAIVLIVVNGGRRIIKDALATKAGQE